MIAISDSCFNLIYLLKQTTGIWRRCTVRSHQPVFHIATLQLETGRCLAFCASTLLISCRSIRRVEAIWRTLEYFCVTAAHCHETSFLKWTSFSRLHRGHSETSILRMHWRGLLSIGSLSTRERLHYTFKCLCPSQIACLNWQAPVFCVTPQKITEVELLQYRWVQLVSELLYEPSGEESLNVRLMDSPRESADWWSLPGRQER